MKLNYSVPDEIKLLLSRTLLNSSEKVESVYAELFSFQDKLMMAGTIQNEEPNKALLSLDNFSDDFSYVKNLKESITDVGIDFPLTISKDSTKPLIMIVAMDPLRHLKNAKDIGYWVPFSILNNIEKEVKYSEVQNLSFFHELLNHYQIYLTDIFKVFYYNGKIKSNQDENFTNKLKIHAEILQEEIRITQPVAILTLGIKSQNALHKAFVNNLQLLDKNNSTIQIEESLLPVLSMPHISNANNAAKKKFIDNPLYNNIPGQRNIKYAGIIHSMLSNLILNKP